ncbi:MAG: Glu/Leu/Phe/Val dehydrogenase [Anaerolineales bacterium]|nr:Glu/Leu/Phe/Val dehydrogenase [Anaerolineales bacterium]
MNHQSSPQLVCTVTRFSEVLGYVVVDSTVGGRSCGGLRMLPDIDMEEIQGLARSMTLKYGFLGLPQGGAKAGVLGDPEAPEKERREKLAEFGRAIAPLLSSRIYVPGTDMGTNNADIRYLLQIAGVAVRRRELRGTNSGEYTAMTVREGVRRAVRHLGMNLSDSAVAIEGFGSVGSALGRLLAAEGARIVAVSTSQGALYRPEGLDCGQLSLLAQQKGSQLVDFYQGAQRLDRAALLELPVDILCPCARHESINENNAERIQARIVCPGANNPVTPGAELVLFNRGVLCLPDFVTNSGGVLGGTMEFASVRKERIAEFIRDVIGGKIANILNRALEQSVHPRQIAVPLALNRFQQVQRTSNNPTALGKMFDLAMSFYRRGWIPGDLVGRLSLSYFERTLA